MAQTKRTVTIIAILAGLVGLSIGAFFLLYQPEPEGIIIGITTLPDSLNPVLEQNISGQNANELLFDGLVNFEVDADSGQMISEFALADSITQDTVTKRNYLVTLKDVKWHDGTPVSAQDVEFSFKAYTNPDNKSPKASYLDSFIQSVKVIDDKNLEFVFRKPIPEFRAYPVLTFKIIPSTYKKQKLDVNLRKGELERSFSTNPVGSGPFTFQTWEIGKWITFKANPAYFRKKPATESLVLRNIIDPIIRMNEFQKKQINLILETTPLDRTAVEKMGEVKISSFMPYAFYQVSLNASSPTFANRDARIAMAAVVQPASLIPGISDRKELALINRGPFPANLLERNFAQYNVEALENPWPTDLAAIKQLASSAGLSGKTIALHYPDSMGSFGQKIVDGLVAQFANLGITVEPKRTGDQVFRRLVFNEKNFEMALLYCEGFDNLYSDIDKYYRTGGSMNIHGLANPELDALFDKWNATSVAPDWIAITRQLHTMISQSAPAVPLFSLQKDVYSRAIQNIVIASDNPFLSAENWAQVIK